MANPPPPPAAAEVDEDATGAVLLPEPVEDTIPKIPLGTPPHPGWVHRDNLQSCTSLNPDEIITASDLVAMAFGRNKPKTRLFQLLYAGQSRGHLHIL